MSRRGPVVVCVLSHRDPPLVHRLVRRVLEGEHTAVVVHHDPRGPALALPRSDRLVTMPDPRPCDWGRLDLARVSVDVLGAARACFPDLSWVLLVSGQDYPCRHMRDIESELLASPHDAFVRWFPVPLSAGGDEHPWQARTRQRYYRRLRLPFSARHIPFPRRPPLGEDGGLYVGDQWYNLGAAAVEHVLERRALRDRLERYLRWCSTPDEALLPTLLLSGTRHLDVVNDRRRFIDWSGAHKHPRVLDESDLPAVERSTDFFARKVELGTSGALLDRLDAVARVPGPGPSAAAR